MTRITLTLLIFLHLFVAAATISAQQVSGAPTLPPANRLRVVSSEDSSAPGSEIEENDVVRVSTNLITVPAEVMDRKGRYIRNHKKEDFRVFENGVEQELSYPAAVQQQFTVALYGVGSNYLRYLAEKTGGRIYSAENLTEVPPALNAITGELGRQ